MFKDYQFKVQDPDPQQYQQQLKRPSQSSAPARHSFQNSPYNMSQFANNPQDHGDISQVSQSISSQEASAISQVQDEAPDGQYLNINRKFRSNEFSIGASVSAAHQHESVPKAGVAIRNSNNNLVSQIGNESLISKDFYDSRAESLQSHTSRVINLDIAGRNNKLGTAVAEQKTNPISQKKMKLAINDTDIDQGGRSVEVGIAPDQFERKSTFNKLNSSFSTNRNNFSSTQGGDTEAGIIMINRPVLDRQIMRLSNMIVISTSTPLYQLWKIIKIIVLFASTITYVRYAAFKMQMEPDEIEHFHAVSVFYKWFFIVDMLANFVTEHHYDSSHATERNLFILVKLYLKGRFIRDLIALLPFYRMLKGLISEKWVHLVYLIRLIRLTSAFELLDHKVNMKQIKLIFNRRMKALIDSNDPLAQSQTKDNNYISKIITIAYIIRMLELIMIISVGSYFFGMIWFIFCELTHDDANEADADNFIHHFDLHTKEQSQVDITLMYFSFTSLSTVGLGDYHPRSDPERLLCAFILVVGVAITTLIIDNINFMVQKINSHQKGFEESQQLSLFMGTMERFNGNTSLPSKFVGEVEEYFKYRWQYNRNNAIMTKEDYDILTQLPRKVQIQIYSEFLFKEFVETYQKYFYVPQVHLSTKHFKMPTISKTSDQSVMSNVRSENKQNEKLMEFHNLLLKYLEPILLQPGQVICGQKETFDMIVFIMKGFAEIGYNRDYLIFENGAGTKEKLSKLLVARRASRRLSLSQVWKTEGDKKIGFQEIMSTIKDKKFVYPIKARPGQAMGLFEVVFGQKSSYIYRISRDSPAHVYFIRTKNWKSLKEEVDEEMKDTFEQFSKQVIADFVNKIYFPISNDQAIVLREEKEERDQELADRIEARSQHMERAGIPQVRVPQMKNSFNHMQVPQIKREPQVQKIIRQNTPDKNRRFSADPTNLVNKLFSQARLREATKKKTSNQQVTSKLSLILKQQSTVSRLSRRIEKGFKKQETRLANAINWVDRIKSKDLKSIVQRYTTSMRMGSASDLSSLMMESRLDKKEISIEKFWAVIMRKVKQQEIWIHKLVRDKEETLKENLFLKKANTDLTSKVKAMQDKVNNLKLVISSHRMQYGSLELEDIELIEDREFSFEDDASVSQRGLRHSHSNVLSQSQPDPLHKKMMMAHGKQTMRESEVRKKEELSDIILPVIKKGTKKARFKEELLPTDEEEKTALKMMKTSKFQKTEEKSTVNDLKSPEVVNHEIRGLDQSPTNIPQIFGNKSSKMSETNNKKRQTSTFLFYRLQEKGGKGECENAESDRQSEHPKQSEHFKRGVTSSNFTLRNEDPILYQTMLSQALNHQKTIQSVSHHPPRKKERSQSYVHEEVIDEVKNEMQEAVNKLAHGQTAMIDRSQSPQSQISNNQQEVSNLTGNTARTQKTPRKSSEVICDGSGSELGKPKKRRRGRSRPNRAQTKGVKERSNMRLREGSDFSKSKSQHSQLQLQTSSSDEDDILERQAEQQRLKELQRLQDLKRQEAIQQKKILSEQGTARMDDIKETEREHEQIQDTSVDHLLADEGGTPRAQNFHPRQGNRAPKSMFHNELSSGDDSDQSHEDDEAS